MSDFSQDLKDFLKSIPDITSIVGSGADSRIYFDQAPEGRPSPFLLLVERGPGDVIETLTGDPGIVDGAWDIYSFGSTRQEANNLGDTVRLNLHRFSGQMGSTWVDNVSLLSYRDSDIDRPTDKSYAARYWTRYPYDITHRITAVGS